MADNMSCELGVTCLQHKKRIVQSLLTIMRIEAFFVSTFETCANSLTLVKGYHEKANAMRINSPSLQAISRP